MILNELNFGRNHYPHFSIKITNIPMNAKHNKTTYNNIIKLFSLSVLIIFLNIKSVHNNTIPGPQTHANFTVIHTIE